MRYWEFALTESQAKKKIAVRQHTAKLAALLANQKVPGHPEITTPAQLIDWLYSLDPTEAKLYFLWLVSRVTNNHDMLADISRASQVLERFQSALRTQHEMGVSSLNPSIEKYQSLAELDSAVSALESSKDYADRAELVRARSESVILHEDSEWVVAIPQTEQTAMYWSRGTTQCINWGDPKGLFPDRTNKFHMYPGIYVIHNKHDPKRIFSIQFPKRQFRDWKDVTVTKDQWDNTNPFIRKVVDYHGKKLLADTGISVDVLISFAESCFNGRWSEAETKIAEHRDVREIITYAKGAIKSRWPEPDRARVENMIIESGDVRDIVTYAVDCIKDRWPEPDRARVENMIVNGGYNFDTIWYAANCIKGRWPEPDRARVENMIIESGDVSDIVTYAVDCIKDRWPEPDRARVENMIIESEDVYLIIVYAQDCIKGRWPEAEDVIFSYGDEYEEDYRNLVQSSQGDGAQ